jgi:F-type H+-transporting ATPase subunit a
MGWLAMLILIIAAAVFKKKSGRLVPSGFQNFVEAVIEGLFSFFDSVTQDRNLTRRFFPWVATIFLFVLFSNWMGILPGVGPIGIYEEHEGATMLIPFFRSAYADVNMTLALAIISVVVTQIMGIRALGFFHDAGKFFVYPFRDFIGAFVGILELVSELAKMISFSFRLFGNIFAGEVLLVVMGFLAPFIAPIPFYGLELFVGLVQALVFSILTLVFMRMAVSSHHEAAH